MAPLLHNLGTRWRRVVNFTLRPLYPKDPQPRYALKGRGVVGTKILKKHKLQIKYTPKNLVSLDTSCTQLCPVSLL